MKILVLGATGMLGNAMFRVLAGTPGLTVTGTARSEGAKRHFDAALASKLCTDIDAQDATALSKLFAEVNPDVVINCVGVVKQLAQANDPLTAIPLNSLLPHQLATLCKEQSARLIHISTDCVFAGTNGNYKESDFPDALDLYGRSKLLGEVDASHCITLRTSIIGHELNNGAQSLIGWFLSQQGTVKGFTRAIFSGLPTVELAHIVRDIVIPNPLLHGVYHVAAAPISKHDLLQLVASAYKKDITITPDETLIIDRSLDAARFKHATGYSAPAWPVLVARMQTFQ